MKKSLILSMIGLMLSIVTASGGNPRLEIGEMSMEGSGCAKLVQRLYVQVTNISAEDYHDWSWWAVNGQADELSPTIFSPSFYGNSEEVFLAPGETKVVPKPVAPAKPSEVKIVAKPQVVAKPTEVVKKEG